MSEFVHTLTKFLAQATAPDFTYFVTVCVVMYVTTHYINFVTSYLFYKKYFVRNTR